MYLRTLSDLSDAGIIEPHSDSVLQVYFLTDIDFKHLVGEHSLYQDYGLGNKFGDFCLEGLVLDAESLDHLFQFRTDYVRTAESELLPNYAEIQKKPTLIHQDGINIYWLDQWIIPKNPDQSWDEDRYYIVGFYENDTDDGYILNYDKVMINGQEYHGSRIGESGLKENAKGFFLFVFSTKEIEKEGLTPFKTLSFKMIAEKIPKTEGGKYEEYFQTDVVEMNFPQPWKVLQKEIEHP